MHFGKLLGSDRIKNEEYDRVFEDLIEFRDQRELQFKIQQYETIKIKEEPPHIIVEKELEAI
ncbi:hypothetical protein MWH30_06455 [Fuchsiella alkaliacetigena]|nr:hypothetical protein [Fuchsiella alkaliacetigena]